MNTIDLQMRCLEGKPIPLEPNLLIHKISFSKSSDIGYEQYNRVINMLCLDKEKIKPYVNDEYESIDVFTFIILTACLPEIQESSHINKTLMEELIEVLSYIFNDKVSFDTKLGCFSVGDFGFLYQDNFEEFQSIIKIRNCLETIEEDMDNPENEMARQLLEKQKKAREKLKKAKKMNANNDDDCEELTVHDLISIFAEAEHMRLEDVFNYDMYQFNNQFNRMKIFKDYEVNIQALLAGAKKEDIQLQHWLSKIKHK